jgi:hypothetical protein
MARDRDDDYTDEPPRRRRRDEDDEGYAEAPRGRRRDDDEDEDRPRRRRRDDDDVYDDVRDRVRRRPQQLTGLDGTFANTNIVMLVLFGCLCGDIALILGIVGLFVCKDPKARSNALIVTLISAVRVAVAVVVIVLGNLHK